MATRRQPLIPGWLIPGISAATLVVAVALAAFLALWWNAPQGDCGSLAGQLSVACGALLLLAGVSLGAALCRTRNIPRPRALSQALSWATGAVASVRNDLDPPGAGRRFRHS